jgi:hypothetical protein
MLRRVCIKGWGTDFQAVSSRSKSQLLDAVAISIVNFEDFAPSEPVTKGPKLNTLIGFYAT